jgi:hypothetical protein
MTERRNNRSRSQGQPQIYSDTFIVEVLRSFWRAQADPKQTRPREKLQLNLEGGFAYSTMAEEGEGLPPGAASRPRTRGATVGAAGGARGAAAWLARAGTASAARRWGRSGQPH